MLASLYSLRGKRISYTASISQLTIHSLYKFCFEFFLLQLEINDGTNTLQLSIYTARRTLSTVAHSSCLNCSFSASCSQSNSQNIHYHIIIKKGIIQKHEKLKEVKVMAICSTHLSWQWGEPLPPQGILSEANPP